MKEAQSKNTTTIKGVLYKSKTLANGEYPIMLRITKDRKRKYISLGISCPLNLWDEKKNAPKRNHPHKDLIEKIIDNQVKEYKEKQLELKAENKEFTAVSLAAKVGSKSKKATVFQYFEEVINRLILSKAIGNANTYKDTYRSLKAYLNDKDITFSELDYSLLIGYETYLRKKGLAETSMAVYFRNLRALFNKAIKENVAKPQHYPFKQFQISKFDLSTRKRAITKEEIKRIEGLQLESGSVLNEARQYFLFSYYGSGINFIDMANLKWKNIVGHRLYYNRAKTGKELSFKLLDPAIKILDYWRPLTGQDQNNYVFPILNLSKHLTPQQIDNRVHKVITRVNKRLKELSAIAGLNVPLTTYVARHTFATVLKKSGINTAVISEAMGHQTEAITQTYLKSFENEILDEATQHLL